MAFVQSRHHHPLLVLLPVTPQLQDLSGFPVNWTLKESTQHRPWWSSREPAHTAMGRILLSGGMTETMGIALTTGTPCDPLVTIRQLAMPEGF